MTMTAFFAKVHRTGGAVAWLVVALWGVAVCYLLVTTTLNGPAARARAEQTRAQEIEKENAVFCTTFGMSPGTDAYRACASDLMEVRRRQSERFREDVDGF